jgi:hypothetical protein
VRRIGKPCAEVSRNIVMETVMEVVMDFDTRGKKVALVTFGVTFSGGM